MAGPYISLYSLSRSQSLRVGWAQSGVTGLGLLFVPTNVAITTSTTGGTGLTATQAYFYKLTATNTAGETTASAEVTVTTGSGATNSNTLTWNQVPGAANINIYRSTTTNTEVFLTSVAGTATTFIDTGAVTPGTATVPSSNTTATRGRLIPQLTQNPSTSALPYPALVDLSDSNARKDIGHHIAEGNMVEVSGVRYTVSGALTGNQIITTTTETPIAILPLQPNLINIGSAVRFTAQGVIAATSPNVLFRMRIGTTGGIGDTSIAATAAVSVGTGTGWDVNGLWSCQAVGSGTTGKVIGNMQTTGHNGSPQLTANTSQANVDTTLPQYAILTMVAGTSGITCTVTNALAEFIQQSPSFPC